ncbi:regulator of telomere elongation helicase 1 homolog [Schistocerca piceifrons]|uniref:regulator of telomere elongation helicase 1 homolog n=1 Tax=Schistocerca piceifrons TaxID=274613 RepID=UPI001F5EDA37|nr:regulator of telomere elongation helicase 1 homolog [Schistocerca piceifrons]
MPEYNIRDVSVNFPFEPYAVQRTYMEKVIECLQHKKNGVLESPTGTGKTLSLLCASLAWLTVKKAQLQMKAQGGLFELPGGDFVTGLADSLNTAVGGSTKGQQSVWGVPKIIYASRTHSQLSQAMQELKRTAYNHVRVTVLGSRNQLCIHPEVSKELNSSAKVHMCRVRVSSRTCYFYNNVESKKEDPAFRNEGILDIEDLVVAGRKTKCCPYFMAHELKQTADVVFLPYNYLLDPNTRTTFGVEINNNVIILDEAHNIEKMCEESASFQISSSDIALCIQEVTQVMEDMYAETQTGFTQSDGDSTPKDFTADDLCVLKTMFLELEKAVDAVEVTPEGSTYPGSFLFELMSKAEITHGRKNLVVDLLSKIIQYLSTTSTSPFQRKGTGLQKFVEVLRIAFSTDVNSSRHIDHVKRCYKVFITYEEFKSTKSKTDTWLSNRTSNLTSNKGKQINYWCFSPGFGMQALVEQGAHCVILTSGTLAPLKPLVSELAIDVPVRLENPHIVTPDQVFVGIVHTGPDGHPLNSSFNTRNDPQYITSLGRTILNLSRIIPGGLLVFFPSYPVLKKCQEEWQLSGIWSQICVSKPILVEPQTKDAFIATMTEYYAKIKDPNVKGACFMAVTRGKVSEGLDFADMNGRAVIITGLPYPPFKDPRVVLKQKYLDENRTKENEMLSGRDWYQLEASRAVNQAMGRVIRHAKDYGAVLLCDLRFENASFKKQLSAWLQPHIKTFRQFGPIVRNIRSFFRQAELMFPSASVLSISDVSLPPVPASFGTAIGRLLNTKEDSHKSSDDNATSWSMNEYTTSASTTQSPAMSNNPFTNGSLLDALEPHTTCINLLNEMPDSVSKNRGTIDIKGSCSQPPPAKKKKMKMAPFTYVLSESNQNTSENAVPLPLSSNRFKEVSKYSSSSRAAPSKSGTDKLDDITNYVKKVKGALDTENYQKFISVVKEYKTESNVKKLLLQLKDIFLRSKELNPYFLGFRAFLKEDHEGEFYRMCELWNVTTV